MISTAQQQKYFERLGVSSLSKQPAQLLTQLHLAHLRQLPFENLDITFNRTIKLNQVGVLDKLIDQHRGGFCYELNYGFYLLLSSLGFEVKLLSGRVFDGQRYGQEFDHLLLSVELADGPVIADVGFGDSFNVPLPLDGSVLIEQHAAHKIIWENNHFSVLKRTDSTTWKPQYIFTTIPRTLEDFRQMANYHQTSPLSIFTRKTICSRLTPDGRMTLSNRKLIESHGLHKNERLLESAEQFRLTLRQQFDISLPDSFQVEQWFTGQN
ncbi:arylamine N-acetyltransferase family protein [Gynuella sunshinyii]|uniref:Arylamine N-acetyltransferase n=1 Tax=Gynuella sunshinyii YC6258 TaxID=1445510 RepID=A0A0C5V9X6_9GAMM|nr:arylamine N-acetyltransferase [Gynuella sunshinyii]AJQ96155.1 arylamine N-acetyltransferase [Gynuella sunshinyii YC6258]